MWLSDTLYSNTVSVVEAVRYLVGIIVEAVRYLVGSVVEAVRYLVGSVVEAVCLF